MNGQFNCPPQKKDSLVSKGIALYERSTDRLRGRGVRVRRISVETAVTRKGSLNSLKKGGGNFRDKPLKTLERWRKTVFASQGKGVITIGGSFIPFAEGTSKKSITSCEKSHPGVLGKRSRRYSEVTIRSYKRAVCRERTRQDFLKGLCSKLCERDKTCKKGEDSQTNAAIKKTAIGKIS